MKKILQHLKEKLTKQEICFIATSVLFGCIFIFAKIAGDDVSIYKGCGNTVAEYWKWTATRYHTWSSRQLIEFLWCYALKTGVWIWCIFMGLSMYIMQKSIKCLFFDANEQQHADLTISFIIFITMIYPFAILTSAGWLSTTTNYFLPGAFLLAAIVPIKKIMCNEQMSGCEFVFYALCTVFACNLEQGCFVLFLIYGTVLIWLLFFFKEKPLEAYIKYSCLFLITACSLTYILICDGNWARKKSEIHSWFPTWKMLGLPDKMDIAVSTTLKWLFTENIILTIAITILLALFIWKRYKQPLFRVIAILPAVCTVIFGPLKPIVACCFPYAARLSESVNYYGAFNVARSGGGFGVLQFIVLLMIAVCILVEIILLNSNIRDLAIDICLVCFGFASRLVMGFSPTVYASSNRTYATLVVCLIAFASHVFANNLALFSEKEEKICTYAFFVVSSASFVNLLCFVFTAFY